ncbi:MAG: serine/threonine protein kinase, partial [Planctomycetaceae bacterium]|nr:serine/threonine protein kinase [Planctomycetaceae bacterium]
VMPYVDCESLQERLDREGQLPTLDILRIAHQVANGLAAAHGQGLVHRDVKPANILLEKSVDRVMLTDFGLARAVDDATLTRTGLIAGTPQYMSPEQARGDAVDTRSDLFSLGSVMYAMATGRPPFRAETSYGILRRVTDEEPRRIEELNSDIPTWLTSLITKLLAKSPDDRFADADHLAELLEACIAHVRQPTVNPLPEEVRLETWGDRFRSQLSQKWRWGVRNPLVLLATVLLLLPLTLWLSGLLNNSKQEPKPQPSIAVSTDNDSTSENSTTNTTDELETEVAPIWHDDLGQQLNELDTEMETLLQSLQPQ